MTERTADAWQGPSRMTDTRQDDALRLAVRGVYSAIAETPAGEHPIPVGRDLALGVGYPPALLADLPEPAVASFAGVSNVSLIAEFAGLSSGALVLDLGCGAGLDSLIAAQRLGPTGRVIGVDFSAAMLARATRAAEEQRAANVRYCLAASEHLPLPDGSVDLVLINGIFNLNPQRRAIFDELGRVVRPGGCVYAAELVLREPLPESQRDDPADWFA